MKKLLGEIKVILFLVLGWRVGLELIRIIGERYIPLRPGFLGPNPWLNLDGVHYLSIAKSGYFTYEQAFFPVYPLLIKLLTDLGVISNEWVALFISHAAFFIGIVGWYLLGKELKLIRRPFEVWPILLFPTSFFYISGYNESLFLALSVWSLLLLLKNKWLAGSMLGGFASGTRLFGFFILGFLLVRNFRERVKQSIPWRVWFIIPSGLISYMVYLGITYGDPLMFIHAQPAFGAGRSGSELIFLPQVVYRYARIYSTVTPVSLNFWVAVLEGATFTYGIYLLWNRRAAQILWPYLFFAGGILLLPTLSGTLSSVPRYFLSAFPLFWLIPTGNKWRDTITGVIFSLGLIVLTILYTRGYFIA